MIGVMVLVLVWLVLLIPRAFSPAYAIDSHVRGKVALVLLLCGGGIFQLVMMKMGPASQRMAASASGYETVLVVAKIIAGFLLLFPKTSRPAAIAVALAFLVYMLSSLSQAAHLFGSQGGVSGAMAAIKPLRVSFARALLLAWTLWFGVRKPAA